MKIKTHPDAERFARYQLVINVLSNKDSFNKRDIYEALKDEKVGFAGCSGYVNFPKEEFGI